MRSGLSNHLSSPNWYIAPIFMNDFLVSRWLTK